MGTLSRTTWTDDDGTGTYGSIINNTELQAIYGAVEGDIKSANFATVTTKSVIDNMLAGEVFHFGGRDISQVNVTSYPAGATLDKLHSGTGVLSLDSALLTGTYKLEVNVKVDNASGVIDVCLVNLTDGSPDTAVTGSTTSGTGSTTGERVRSGAITFAASGATKSYGIKAKINNTAYFGNAWGIRLVRTA